MCFHSIFPGIISYCNLDFCWILVDELEKGPQLQGFPVWNCVAVNKRRPASHFILRDVLSHRDTTSCSELQHCSKSSFIIFSSRHQYFATKHAVKQISDWCRTYCASGNPKNYESAKWSTHNIWAGGRAHGALLPLSLFVFREQFWRCWDEKERLRGRLHVAFPVNQRGMFCLIDDTFQPFIY